MSGQIRNDVCADGVRYSRNIMQELTQGDPKLEKQVRDKASRLVAKRWDWASRETLERALKLVTVQQRSETPLKVPFSSVGEATKEAVTGLSADQRLPRCVKRFEEAANTSQEVSKDLILAAVDEVLALPRRGITAVICLARVLSSAVKVGMWHVAADRFASKVDANPEKAGPKLQELATRIKELKEVDIPSFLDALKAIVKEPARAFARIGAVPPLVAHSLLCTLAAYGLDKPVVQKAVHKARGIASGLRNFLGAVKTKLNDLVGGVQDTAATAKQLGVRIQEQAQELLSKQQTEQHASSKPSFKEKLVNKGAGFVLQALGPLVEAAQRQLDESEIAELTKPVVA